MARKSKKKPRPGKSSYFPRVKRMTFDYPGGQIEIIKTRRGQHRTVAPPEVKITETREDGKVV